MEGQADFKELLALFNAHKVEYLIVGAYALALHGAPRMTGDVDIFIHATRATDRKRDEADLEALGEQ